MKKYRYNFLYQKIDYKKLFDKPIQIHHSRLSVASNKYQALKQCWSSLWAFLLQLLSENNLWSIYYILMIPKPKTNLSADFTHHNGHSEFFSPSSASVNFSPAISARSPCSGKKFWALRSPRWLRASYRGSASFTFPSSPAAAMAWALISKWIVDWCSGVLVRYLSFGFGCCRLSLERFMIFHWDYLLY